MRILGLVLGICVLLSACGADSNQANNPSNGAATADGSAAGNTSAGSVAGGNAPSSQNPDSNNADNPNNPDNPNSPDNPDNTANQSGSEGANGSDELANNASGETSGEITPLVLTPVASLADPMVLIARPNTGSAQGDLYVGTRQGQVWLLSADGNTQPELVLDISDLTETGCENGLLGMAFNSDGSLLYLHYTNLQQDNQIVEYPMSGQRAVREQARTVLSVSQPACNHNGGSIAFGPRGYLWVGIGDGGGRDDQFGHGQNLDSLLGTVLRIDPSGASGTDASGTGASGDAGYSIPADNPFSRGGGLPEIWAYGARNPWRFSFDTQSGDLWIGDVGQNNWEEVHVLAATDGWLPGINLGWPLFEGHERFSGTVTPQDLQFPAFVYSHDEGCSVTGGYVYRGSAISWLQGAYVFGDYCTSSLWGLRTDASGNSERFELGVGVPQVTLVSFGQDAAGELYVLSFDDTVYRLEPA